MEQINEMLTRNQTLRKVALSWMTRLGSFFTSCCMCVVKLQHCICKLWKCTKWNM